MLRHIYFLTLLLYINITFSFEYLMDRQTNHRPVRKSPKSNTLSKSKREKINGKRQDYEMAYDNDPVAQIDVASFIQNPDNIFDSKQPYDEHDQRKQFYYRDYGSLMDYNEEIPSDVKDHQSFITNPLPEVDVHSKIKHIVPQNIDIDALSGGYHSELVDPHKISAKKKIGNKLSFDIGHNPEKKCALRNMKLPFFSRNQDAKIKEKKHKKKRPFRFGKLKKQTQSVYNSITEHLNTNIKSGYTDFSHVYNKFKKRSYLKRLCPSCRKNIVKKDNTNSQRSQEAHSGIIHNSRQYYKTNYNKEKGNEMETPSIIKKYTNFDHNLYLNSLEESRRKRELDLLIEDKQKREIQHSSK